LIKGVHTPGFDTKTKGGKKTTRGRAQSPKGEWRKRLNNIQRQGGTKKEKRLLISSNELLCFYTNARNLINKMDQLEAWVHDIKPDIIGVTESWLTSAVLDSELALEGYDLFRKDRPVDRVGGGVLLCVKSELHAAQYELSAEFPEQVWCYFSDANNIKCYVGVCYRTPNIDIYNSPNHTLLQDIINELGST